jgi:hypothetical protein
MSGIQGVGGPGQVVYGSGDVATASGGAGAPGSLLPDPVTQLAMTGDPGAMVAALVVETAKDEKDVSRHVEQAESTIQENEERSQVAEMHQKANDMRTQALVTGAIGAGAAGLSMASAGCNFQGTAQRAFDAGSKFMSAGQGAVSGEFGAANEDADANVAMHEHNASDAGRAASQAYDNGRDAQKLLDSAIDFFREYSSSAEQAKLAAVHRE